MFTVFASPSSDRAAEVAAEWRLAAARKPGHAVWFKDHLVVRTDAHSGLSASPANPFVVCGHARLDDADLVARDLGLKETSDLELIRAQVASRGSQSVTSLAGVYAIVMWNRLTAELVATRDALGLLPLFYTVHEQEIFLSDSIDQLSTFDDVDKRFVAAFLATGFPAPDSTIRPRVQRLKAGTLLRWANGCCATDTYWSVTQFRPRKTSDLQDDAAEFRALVERAVSQYVGNGRDTWADLSGGLDSSTVASMAGLLGEQNPQCALGGTVTYTGSIGDENEERFSDAVVSRYGFRNLKVVDEWPWRADDEPPPVTEEPARDFPFFARDRRVARVLSEHGARTLLSGVGPDAYLPRTTLHIPDLVWTGQLRQGLGELWRCTLARHTKLWYAPRDLVRPLFPVALQRWMSRQHITRPPWLRPDFVRRYGVDDALVIRTLNTAAPGLICQAALAHQFAEISAALHNWRLLSPLEIRHPLLYRPLVDFCLRLPHRHRTHLDQFKPVLRVAMKGVVPDRVLNRRTKGSSLLPRYAWAFRKERQLLDRLLKSSILADIGCIEPSGLSDAIDRAAAGQTAFLRWTCFALSLETWLAVKSGRFNHHLHHSRSTAYA